MKPNITITIDDMGVMTLRSTFNGEFLDTIRLSVFEVDALSKFFLASEGIA